MYHIVILVLLAVIGAASAADSTDEEDVKPITHEIGLTLHLCHPYDLARIHVIPIPLSTNRHEGWFVTSNRIVTLGDLTMLPDGTNRLEIQTICRGKTSEVAVALFDIQRPPPKPVVGLTMDLQQTNNVAPPTPPGMLMPLPGGHDAKDYLWRAERAKIEGPQRSQ